MTAVEAADGKDTRSESQKTFDRNYENAKSVSQRKQKDQQSEEMRDKSHDNRVKVNKDTSVGGQTNPPGVDIRKTTP